MVGRAAAPLVGRASELAALAQVLAGSLNGRGAAIVVAGPGGIGKTRLVDEALAVDQLGETRSDVYRATCGELDRDIPFAGIAAALGLHRGAAEPAAAALADLIGNPGGGDIRFRVVDDIVDLVERLALRHPLALVLDDIHRADPGTLLVIKRLARDCPGLPVAIVCTRRLQPARSEVDDAMSSATVIELLPLADADVADLSARVLGVAPGRELLDTVAGCGGNPLYVTELLRALRADGRIDDTDAAVAQLVPGEVPMSLRLTVLAQLSSLDEEAVAAVRVASCLGVTFDGRDLATCLARPPAELLVLLDSAVRSGVLVETGARLGFRHDLLRDAVYQDVPEALRLALHADIAARLRAAGRPVTELAPHLLRSAREGDVTAVTLLWEAARAAEPLSVSVAAELLQRARSVAGPDHPDYDDITVDLASAFTAAGHHADANALARSVLAGRPAPALAQRARAVVVQAARARDRARDAVDVLEALEAAAAEGSDAERARSLALVCRTWAQLGEGERARSVGARTTTLADAVGDDDARCLTSWSLAWAAAHEARPTEILPHVLRAVDIARHGAVGPATRADVAWGYLLLFGLLEPLRADTRALAVAEFQRAEAAGHLWVLPMLHGMLAFDHVRWLEIEDAVLMATSAIRAADDLGSARFVSFAYSTLGRAWSYAGDLEQARHCLDAATRLASQEDDPVFGELMIGLARSLYEELSGHPELAADALLGVLHPDGAPNVGQLLGATHATRLVRCLLLAGRSDDARGVLRLIEGLHSSFAFGDAHRSTLPTLAAHIRMLLDPDADAARAMVEGWRAAGIAGSTIPDALADAAEVLAAAGHRDEAIAYLDEAIETWRRAGATLVVAQLTARLRELGVRRGVAGVRRRPTTGWDALTEAELRVADLVADNLTYREIGERLFLSRRTVESHVARIFTKLDLSSRRELSQLVMARRA